MSFQTKSASSGLHEVQAVRCDVHGSAAVFDPEKLDTVLDLAGRTQAAALLASLANEIRSRFDGRRSHPDGLAADAHALSAAAAVFGFDALATACRTLEAAVIQGGADQSLLIEPVLAARRTALREIERLLRGLKR